MAGAAPLHVRAISLILAISVVVGSWLALEYSSRGISPTVPADQPSRGEKPVDQAGLSRNLPPDAGSVPAELPRDVNLTFKCEKQGRISFSDHPCEKNAKVVSVTATEKLPPVRDDRMVQMKQQVAQMEADRHAREESQAALFAARAAAPDSSKAMQCKEVDDRVAYIDSLLRQPHSAFAGDELTAQRKWWMDKRFELRC